MPTLNLHNIGTTSDVCMSIPVPLVNAAHFRVATYHIHVHVLLVLTQVASLRDVGISLALLDNLPFDRVSAVPSLSRFLLSNELEWSLYRVLNVVFG